MKGLFGKNNWKGRLFGFMAFAIVCLTSTTSISMGMKPMKNWLLGGSGDAGTPFGLFPAAECNVNDSMLTSRDKILDAHSPVSPQGIVPWPDVTGRFKINGVWLSESRGVYIVIQQTSHRDSPNFGALNVEFYSACDHELLAKGKRILTKDDWTDPKVMVYLTHHNLYGRRIYAEINVMMGDGQDLDDNVAIRIIELKRRAETKDLLFTGRFL